MIIQRAQGEKGQAGRRGIQYIHKSKIRWVCYICTQPYRIGAVCVCRTVAGAPHSLIWDLDSNGGHRFTPKEISPTVNCVLCDFHLGKMGFRCVETVTVTPHPFAMHRIYSHLSTTGVFKQNVTCERQAVCATSKLKVIYFFIHSSP